MVNDDLGTYGIILGGSYYCVKKSEFEVEGKYLFPKSLQRNYANKIQNYEPLNYMLSSLFYGQQKEGILPQGKKRGSRVSIQVIE